MTSHSTGFENGYFCVLFASLLLSSGCTGPPMPSPTTAPAGVLVAAFEATVYEVHLPPDRVGQLDSRALSGGKDSASFKKALEALGKTKVLYRVDQAVKLAGDRVSIGTRAPMVTGTRRTASGQAIKTVSYRPVGAVFKIVGWPQAGGRLRVELNIEVSSLSDSPVMITKDVPAAVIRNTTLAHSGPVRPDRPFVIVSADADSPDAAGQAVAYVARVVLGRPQ